MEIDFAVVNLENCNQAEKVMQDIGCDPRGIKIMKSKAIFKVIRVMRVRTKAANLLKQTFLSKGAEAALSKGAADLSSEYTDVLLMATLQQYRQAIANLKMQPWGLPKLAKRLEDLLCNLDHASEKGDIAQRQTGRITDDGHLFIGEIEVAHTAYDDIKAKEQIERLQNEGADAVRLITEGIHHKISAEDELIQLLPFLRKIMLHSALPIMIQSDRQEIIQQSLACGVQFIDINGGFLANQRLLAGLAQYQKPIVITFKKREFLSSCELMKEICLFLQKSINRGISEGLKAENIIFAPFTDFGENIEKNFQIIKEMERLKSFGCPLLMNFGDAALMPQFQLHAGERHELFLAAVTLSKVNGAKFFCGNQISTFKNIIKVLG